ncbi:glycosyltransferase, partial [bacterium]|nr:glycosyltransferase [bacterium]
MSTNGKINVLQLIEGLNWGGAETKLLELIGCMDSDRFKTTVCSLGMGERIKGRFDELGVNFVSLTRRRKIDPKLIWDVASLMRRERIDVVMTTLFYADVIGALARTLAPVKAAFSWETISAPEWLLTHRLWAYRFAMRFCDKVISVSETTGKWLVEKRGLPQDKVVVIPYGVNLEQFTTGRKDELKTELGIPAQSLVIGTVARLHHQKGHRYLIEAAPGIIRKHPNIRFVFVGDGALRQELEERIRSYGLQDNFVFLGFCEDVNDLLKTFDVFVLPSLYEGLPNVILEAMATGLPVVATAVDGTPELIVENETGYLVPPKDPKALEQKIKD